MNKKKYIYIYIYIVLHLKTIICKHTASAMLVMNHYNSHMTQTGGGRRFVQYIVELKVFCGI